MVPRSAVETARCLPLGLFLFCPRCFSASSPTDRDEIGVHPGSRPVMKYLSRIARPKGSCFAALQSRHLGTTNNLDTFLCRDPCHSIATRLWTNGQTAFPFLIPNASSYSKTSLIDLLLESFRSPSRYPRTCVLFLLYL